MGSAELFNAAPDYFIHLEGTLHLKLNQKIAKSPLQIYIYLLLLNQKVLYSYNCFFSVTFSQLDEACSSSYNNVDGGKCFHEGRRIKYTQPNTETVVEINWLVYLQLISLSVSPGRSLLLSKN